MAVGVLFTGSWRVEDSNEARRCEPNDQCLIADVGSGEGQKSPSSEWGLGH